MYFFLLPAARSLGALRSTPGPAGSVDLDQEKRSASEFFPEIDRGGVLSSLYRSKILNKANHRAPGLCGSLGGSGAKPAPWGAPEAGSLGGPAAKPAPWGAPVEPAPWGAQGGSRLLGGRRAEAGSLGGTGVNSND